jgi:Cu/Ag efflux pump CusA
LPAALTGGLMTARVTDGALSAGSLAGLLAVFGIAVYNAIMLLTRYQRLERYEGESFGPGLVSRGTRERLGPISMTILIAGVALAPALFFGDVPGLELVRPMAVVALGGLVTLGLVDLLFLPALFLSLGVSSALDLDPIIGNARGPLYDATLAAPGLARS